MYIHEMKNQLLFTAKLKQASWMPALKTCQMSQMKLNVVVPFWGTRNKLCHSF
jgi:hypothetical protein